MKNLDEITITDITDVMTVHSLKGKSVKINNRTSYGISFCAEGQITYTHCGKKLVSDPYHAVILPQSQTYELYGDKEGIFPVINFLCADELCDTIVSIPIKNVQPYIIEFEQIKSLFLFEKNRPKIMSIFYNMFYRLSAEANPSSEILFPAIKYLEENYFSPSLSTAVLAQKCNISEVYFRKVFTKHYGITPKQYIIDIRIEKAKQLLTDGILKISAVSEKCGFSNPYHFCRQFKQKAGLTPTEYMKQNKIYKI